MATEIAATPTEALSRSVTIGRVTWISVGVLLGLLAWVAVYLLTGDTAILPAP